MEEKMKDREGRDRRGKWKEKRGKVMTLAYRV
jgi:hypothetical protein